MIKNFNILIALATIAITLLSGEKTMADDVLTNKQHNIVQIASYTATGDTKSLSGALNNALDQGMTINEIKEILVQMYAYCGFPRSLNGIATFINVTNERKNKNIVDNEGVAPTPLSADVDKDAYGEKVRSELVGGPTTAPFVTFAPAIDNFLKEHLFADIFARGVLTKQEREIATIAALASMKGVEPQLAAHIMCGKNTGLTQEQIDAILLSVSRPKFEPFGLGNKNDAYAQYFIGQSYLKTLTSEGVGIANVTFEPKCRNNWHIHHKGGQILLVTDGRGYYQEWGKPAQELHAGDVVNIPAEVKHWHGAAKDSWFVHIALGVPADGASTEWLEPVSDEEYNKLK